MTTTAAGADVRAGLRAQVRAALPAHLDRLGWDGDRLAAHQQDALRALLRHAREHSAFHRDRLAGVDVDRFALADLPSLPTMTKADTMEAFDELVTDPRLTRARVEEHLARAGTEAELLLGGYMVLASGGSSGRRGVFVYDTAPAVDYLLGLTRAGLSRLLATRVPPGGMPMAMLAAGRAVHASRVLPSLFTGDLLAVRSVPVTLPVQAIVARLNDMQPPLLQGYPSILSVLAAEQQAGRLRIAPAAITGSSEQFPAEVKARVAEVFGVSPVDQFGSSEGVLGVSAPGEQVIELASDLAIVEPVDEHNRPVPAGTPSAKVLVTNLMNPVQPLIRYELEDRFTVVAPDGGRGHLRVTVEGRADDVLRWPVATVHPLALRSVLTTTPHVVEYQVRQTAGGIHVLVVPAGPFDLAGLATRLGAALRGAGLAEPSVTVDLVGAVPADPATGKATRFLPRTQPLPGPKGSPP